MKKSFFIIYIAVALDAMGVGLIFPLLPSLLREMIATDQVAWYIGITGALYAVMQFIFSPVLGRFSDRLGRRPVLLLSLGGAAISYSLLAGATTLWLLLAGRAMAGLTSANLAVATAYLTDVTPVQQQASRFGIFNALSGIGFVIGPVLGGWLGEWGLRLPFLVAMGLNVGTLLLAFWWLSESRKPHQNSIERSSLNPLEPLKWAFSKRPLLPLISIFFLLNFSGEVYGICWALWSQATFGWNALWIGLSLGTLGICQASVQAFLTAWAVKRLGNRSTIYVGLACSSLAVILLSQARQAWLVFAVMPIFALAGIGTPALQALATGQISDEQQGTFQGVLASVISLASILGPLVFSSLYGLIQPHWPGGIWLTVLAINLLLVPLMMKLREISVNAESVGNTLPAHLGND